MAIIPMKNYVTREELVRQLGIHPLTLNRKIKKSGLEIPPGRLSSKSVQAILETLGFNSDKWLGKRPF